MSSNLKKISLSAKEVSYLEGANFLTDMLKKSILGNGNESNRAIIVEVEKFLAFDVADILSDEIAKKGFAVDYSLNVEGELLDSLVNRFAS